MAEFAVIGLGRFGRAVARNLALEKQSVLAIDRLPDRLERIAPEVDAVIKVDTTDEAALSALHLERMECVVVAIGSRATEASILTVALLRELAVPRIVARAFDERHARLLLTIGASEVLNPEDEIGRRLAQRLAYPEIHDQIRLGDAVLAEVETPEAFVGTVLRDLELPERYAVSLLAIRRQGATQINPPPDSTVESGDVLVLLGGSEAVRRLAELT